MGVEPAAGWAVELVCPHNRQGAQGDELAGLRSLREPPTWNPGSGGPQLKDRLGAEVIEGTNTGSPG